MKDYSELLDYINGNSGFNSHNGIVLSHLEKGHAEAICEIKPQAINPQGTAHGALIFGMCDVVAGASSFSYGKIALTLNSSINYLRPGKGDKLRAVGKTIKSGRTTAVCETKVYDTEDRLIAKGDFTYFYVADDMELPSTDSMGAIVKKLREY